MNPIEATTIAVGAIAIITILVFIYKKMKNIVSRASSTGSYSPKDFRKGAKRGSSSSGGSEDGQVVLSQETKDVPENPDNEFTDVTVHRTEDCVETKTTYLLSKSNLRATSSKVVEDSVIPTKEKYQEKTDDTFEKPLDFVEVISEKQIVESNDPPEVKPSRKGKAPVTPPEKFTSDKSAASSLNQDSLRSVSHAISGILKDQMPEIVVAEKIEGGRVGDSEYGIIGAETTSASQSRNLPTGEGYITPISDTQELPTDQGDINYEQSGSKTVRPHEKQTDSLHIGESNTSTREEASDLLQASLKTEHDGSEYFSADEISESSQESFSPRTLIPDISDSSTDSTGDSACGRKRTLRASDLYNVDDATEYGRQESTDEDFLDTSDSLGENKESESSTDTAVFRDLETYQVEPELLRGESERAEILHDGKLTSSTPQQAETEVHKRNRLNAAYDDYLEEFPSHLPRNVHLQNLINSENDSSRVYEGDDAESVVSEIIKTSNLDSTTTQSIRIDLGPSVPSLSASADALESATSKQDALIKEQVGENSGGSELHLKESINLTGRDLDGCIISKEERESLQFDLDHQKEHSETFDTGRNLQDFIVPKKEIGITQIDQQYSGELTKEKWYTSQMILCKLI
ncbi:hypothetical protein HHI36_017614 [Cryptolaemus montrouzieri]|uniref:Uncharacterized protein n=1 Tax=Cryptolaemus montrouzieri TaxID=559131 RepID=A0ABD2NN64_9CUCU